MGWRTSALRLLPCCDCGFSRCGEIDETCLIISRLPCRPSRRAAAGEWEDARRRTFVSALPFRKTVWREGERGQESPPPPHPQNHPSHPQGPPVRPPDSHLRDRNPPKRPPPAVQLHNPP